MGFAFFTDTHISLEAIMILRYKGLDVQRSIEAGFAQNAPDEDLLAFATQAQRVVITCDQDFETLAFNWQAEGRSHASIIYFNQKTDECSNISLIVEVVELVFEVGDISTEQFNHFWRFKG